MKIALAQRNPTIGAFPAIRDDMRGCLEQIRGTGVDLLVFPELSLCGYPPRDLLDRQAFIRHMQALAEEAAQWTATPGSPAIIVGIAVPNNGPGRPHHNAAMVLDDGRICETVLKTLLPSYDVFDEFRYFEPGPGGRVVEVRGTRVGLSICEDIWNDVTLGERPGYTENPIVKQVQDGAELLVNIAASPWGMGKDGLRQRMLSGVARRHGLPLVAVNQVGGNDELLFDGNSMAFNAKGAVIAHAAAFAPDLVTVDLAADPSQPLWQDRLAVGHREERELRSLYQALVMGVKDYTRKCGFTRGVIGLSGGIDSALVAVIIADALGAQNVRGVALPSRYSSHHSLEDAEQLARNLGIAYDVVPIDDVFQAMLDRLQPLWPDAKEDVTEENLQPRVRGNILMAISNKTGAMLFTTGNKSELAVGYATLYGDMCGGLAVIADMPKTLVWQLSRFINAQVGREVIPRRSIEKEPSAELKADQFDTDSLPEYAVLDAILERHIVDNQEADEIAAALRVDRDVVDHVVRLVRISEYKRWQYAPGLKVTWKAFGTGRRYPIAHGWRNGT